MRSTLNDPDVLDLCAYCDFEQPRAFMTYARKGGPDARFDWYCADERACIARVLVLPRQAASSPNGRLDRATPTGRFL